MQAMAGATVTAALDASPWFSALPREARNRVANSGSIRWFNQGAAIFRQGDATTGLHAVLSGEAKVLAMSRNGVESLVALLRPVEWTGYLACLDGLSYAFTVSASQDCEVFTLPIAAVRTIFFDDAKLLRHLIAPQLAADRKLFGHIVNIAADTPMQRLARRIVDLGRRPYDSDSEPAALTHVSQTELAITAMMSRQSTNALLHELEKAGAVEIGYGSVTIVDPARLSRIAEGN